MAGSDKLSGVMAYLCAHYPHPSELSKARLTKMVYLADWRAALDLARQITPIRWTFNHYGPYVDDVLDVARAVPGFDVLASETMYGTPKEIIRVDAAVAPALYAALTAEDRHVCDQVVAATSSKYWQDFIRLVYSTHPIATQPRYTDLDLVALAREYRSQRAFDGLQAALADSEARADLRKAMHEAAVFGLLGEDVDDPTELDLPWDFMSPRYTAAEGYYEPLEGTLSLVDVKDLQGARCSFEVGADVELEVLGKFTIADWELYETLGYDLVDEDETEVSATTTVTARLRFRGLFDADDRTFSDLVVTEVRAG
jgi:hypothetical protein